jgi:hypothetical protein
MHRRYLISIVPVYILIDSMSGGLAYAPKTGLTGFLLCYCLSLLRNDVRAPLRAVPVAPVAPVRPIPPPPPPPRAPAPALRLASDKPMVPRLPHHG